MARRRYCSVTCRQRLRFKLNLRTGLLRTLNTRYASFSFTDRVVILDVLPYGEGRIFSFIYPRSPRGVPAEDFSRMADVLGTAWWDERRRTHKRYLATRLLFEQASRNGSAVDSVMPFDLATPRVNGSSLVHLQIGKTELASPRLQQVIKNAYRLQAKRHHPDRGGSTAMFRKIQSAYEDLLRWAEAPSFVRRTGFPDKWFYDGERNRWVQPTPERKS